MLAERDILKLISSTYDAKVEAWPQQHIIRITSDYDNCLDIFKLFLHTLDNIKVSTIDVNVVSMPHTGSAPHPKRLKDHILQKIEGYTNTLVRSQDTSSKKVSTGILTVDRILNPGQLRVYYLGPDDTDLLETERLINQILRPASPQSLKLAWSQGDHWLYARPAPVLVGNRMSMLDRNEQWSRWCGPPTMNGITEEEEKEGPDMHGELAFDTLKSFFGQPDDTAYQPYSNTTPHWTPEIEYHDSVKLGQVLFPAKVAESVTASIKRRSKKKKEKDDDVIIPTGTKDIGYELAKQPRAFLPLVPGLLPSLESLGSLEKSEEFVQIRLSPSSKNGSLPVPLEALPDLEMRISFDHEDETTSVIDHEDETTSVIDHENKTTSVIKDVRLVHRKEMDFLQPQNILDMRFVRSQCVYAKEDSIDPRIASFVQNSNFDRWGTDRLKSPPGLSLSIPALAVRSHRGFDPKMYETLSVDYASCGLEHGSSLTMPYQDPDCWPTLTYTKVEAGPFGGRRDELSLHSLRFTSKHISPTDDPDPDPDPDPSAASNIDEIQSLSDDTYTSILFHKTASLIETMGLAASHHSGKPIDGGNPLVQGLDSFQIKGWRRTRVSSKLCTFRKVRTAADVGRTKLVPRGQYGGKRVRTGKGRRLKSVKK